MTMLVCVCRCIAEFAEIELGQLCVCDGTRNQVVLRLKMRLLILVHLLVDVWEGRQPNLFGPLVREFLPNAYRRPMILLLK